MTRHRLLYDWFEPVVKRYPDHPAIEVGGASLTYAELRSVAHRCATAILEVAGAEVPRRVGLFSDRTLAAYASYLAILRLGATVVPLSLDAPVARTSRIIRAAQLEMIVGSDACPDFSDYPLKSLTLRGEQLEDWRSDGPVSLPQSIAAADDFAYILFTSGSTGIPKGVPLRHRNLEPFLTHIVHQYPAGPSARISQVADLTFDPSVHDMFIAWGTGGTLVVPSKRDVRRAVSFINENRITHWFSVPTVIAVAAQLGDLKHNAMPALQWSLFSGEPLTYALADKWQLSAPNSTIDNIYGPTELTGCYDYRLPRSRREQRAVRTRNGTVPIGRNYPGVEFAVVDITGYRSQTGELLLRGAQRFPGYLDPTENNGRFLAEIEGRFAIAQEGSPPLSEELWYATGDLVAETDGVLVHLGRKDHQVKVNGQRVEVGEVEETLRRQAGVLEAVVIAQTAPASGTQLRAALTGVVADDKAVLAALREELPAYMVPSRLLVLDELPRNANGKTDRSAVTELLFPVSTDTQQSR